MEKHSDFEEKCHIKYKIKYQYSWTCYFKKLFNRVFKRNILTDEEIPLL